MRPGAVEQVRVSAFELPTEQPEADGTFAWDSVTIVVVEVASGDDVGVGWTYGPVAVVDMVHRQLAPLLVGRPVLDVTAAWLAMVRRIRNDTRPGLAGYALSAVDLALWDLKARRLGVSLCDLLGTVQPSVAVYGSGGFTTYDQPTLERQLRGWLDLGIGAVKIKIGESDGSRPDRDLERVRTTREVVGPEVDVMVDANGGYERKQAVRMAESLREQGVVWFEEPVSSDDLEGLRLVRDSSAVDVAAGEYGSHLEYFRRMCASGSVDCLQVDATRCGGATGWLHASHVAAAYGLHVSSHCAPSIHLHLAAATAHLRHCEWFHDHVRIEQRLFDGVVPVVDGRAAPDRARAGNGLGLRTGVRAEAVDSRSST